MSKTQLTAHTTHIQKQVLHVKQVLKEKYKTAYGALYAPEDKHAINACEELAREIRSRKPTMLILVGIGGSNLGAMAIGEALYGKFYNNLSPDIKLFCADTIDQEYTQALCTLAEKELRAGNQVILTIITKSGSTTETLINGALFINLLETYYTQEKLIRSVIIITDHDSPLWHQAKLKNYYLLEIPKEVGGRFSVFSAVGLLPLAILGIDIRALCAGACAMRELCLDNNLFDNPAALSSLLIFEQMAKKIHVLDLFIFSPNLALLGSWYRQLVGESLGKKEDLSGALVETGITPTVSIGTIDLHSVAQLYLAGPRDKFTQFIKIDTESTNLTVPADFIPQQFAFLKNKSITAVKRALFDGTIHAFAQAKRPFTILELPEINSYYIGQFLMLKMCEIIYLANLLTINPFDQPAVELYKKETQRLLNT